LNNKFPLNSALNQAFGKRLQGINEREEETETETETERERERETETEREEEGKFVNLEILTDINTAAGFSRFGRINNRIKYVRVQGSFTSAKCLCLDSKV